MAANEQDPLLRLRQAIAAGQAIVPSATGEAGSPEVSLARASHLLIPSSSSATTALPVDAPTRFISSSERPVDLRSIYFAWLNRELAIPEYNASATALNAELEAGGAKVQNLGFIERLDLITWLEGASDESEYIKPLVGDAEAAGAAAPAAPATTKAGPAAQARAGKGTMDPRLASIYDGERRMGDRNTVLRGIKPTDFSHVRKLAAPFIQRKSQPSATTLPSTSAALSLNQKGPSRRPDPIILLSPSASSLLRLSNARSFLEDGKFVPPDAGASTVSMLHVQRSMRGVDATGRPVRFILVEGPEQFKPEYWNRVVAVFTTGQAWQFKNYKWSDPNELFKHVQGIFVGWRGDQPPDNVRDWGHRVLAAPVDRWRGGADAASSSRFRDKEAVESIWKTIELNMRSKGWRKDAAPTAI